MKKSTPIFIRLLLLGGVATGGYYLYQHQSLLSSFSLSRILGAQNISLNKLPFAANVIDQTKQKLTQSQPIVETNSPTPSVQGASTEISIQAQQLVSSSLNQINHQLQNLPKQEAAKILRQACDQVAKELEK